MTEYVTVHLEAIGEGTGKREMVSKEKRCGQKKRVEGGEAGQGKREICLMLTTS